MRVLLTFDYELFFGTNSGTVDKCLIGPTNALLDLSRKYAVPMTFFIDIGYVLKLREYAARYPELQTDLDKIQQQVSEMLALNCSVQLHIHPHWERSAYEGGKWQIVTDGAYRLHDFPDDELEQIVKRYYQGVEELTGKKPDTFRAGGWCIQPFSRLKKVFTELHIVKDSSVFPGGSFQSRHYQFDFTSVAPFSDAYRFESDVCVSDPDGSFTEFPIASWRYSPLFYWQLYGWGRLRPSQHKMWGDGNFLAQPGRKQSVLTGYTWNHVSADGYYAGMLQKQAKVYASKGVEHFVVIGHPKGLTHYAVRQLEEFIRRGKNKYSFQTFSGQ